MRYFLLFLLFTGMIINYVTYLTFYIMMGICKEHGLWQYQDQRGMMRDTPFSYVFQYLVYTSVPVVALFLFTVFIGMVVYGFLGYHLWLVARGTTTNETFKWSAVNRARQQFLAQQERKKQNSSLTMDVDDEDAPFVQGRPLVNIYNRGVLMNFYEVFFPLADKTRHSVTPHSHTVASKTTAKPSQKKN